MTSAPALLITRDTVLNDRVGAIAAAVGVEVTCVGDVGDARQWWSRASVVLIGFDAAGAVLGLALPARSGVHVVGHDAAEAVRWSVPLGAMGVVLPEQTGMLTSVLEGAAGAGERRATVVRVVGGSGGVGASTLAAGLAQRAAKAGRRVALVECEPHGGGIDLMFGADDAPGWRWPDLASAAGHIGSLGAQLPNVSGVDLVSTARGRSGRGLGLPAASAVGAVLGSLMRSHELVVLDGGWGDRVRLGPETVVFVVAAGVRSVLAARSFAIGHEVVDARLVMRRGPGWRLEPDQVAQALGLELVGIVDDDRRLPRGLETGDPPGRAGGRFAKQVDAILTKVAP